MSSIVFHFALRIEMSKKSKYSFHKITVSDMLWLIEDVL